jgi:hypothetical protein
MWAVREWEESIKTPLWKEHYLAPLAKTTFAHPKIPYLKFCRLNLQAQEAEYAAPQFGLPASFGNKASVYYFL